MYILTIALRHLRSRPITWVAMISVSLIVVVYLLVISVSEGFTQHWMGIIRSVMADINVRVGHYPSAFPEPKRYAEIVSEIPGVKGVTYRLEAPALAQFDTGRTVTTVFGIDLPEEIKVGRLGKSFPQGIKEFGQSKREGVNLPCALLGIELKNTYDLRPGDLATFIYKKPEDEDALPGFTQFEILGFFQTKDPTYDRSAFVDRKHLAGRLGLSEIDTAKTLVVWLDDPNTSKLESIGKNIKTKVVDQMTADGFTPEFIKMATVETWKQMSNNYYLALERQNLILRFILMLFLVFIGFVLFLIFGRLVAEKISDIGLFRALGATQSGICSCFLLQGMFIAVFGLLIGIPAALVFIENINWVASAAGVDIFPVETHFVDQIPTHLRMLDIWLIIGFTLIASFLGSLWPAWRAGRLKPVESLRKE